MTQSEMSKCIRLFLVISHISCPAESIYQCQVSLDYVSPNNGGDGSIDDDDDDNDDNNGNDSGPHLQNIERSSPLPIPNGEVFSDPPPPYQVS